MKGALERLYCEGYIAKGVLQRLYRKRVYHGHCIIKRASQSLYDKGCTTKGILKDCIMKGVF